MFNPGDLKQGDVNFIPVESLPEKRKEVNSNVLALGESTGHFHALVCPGEPQKKLDKVDGLRFFKTENGETYIQVEKPLEIKHQEHGAFIVDARDTNYYKIEIDREWDYEANESRRVID